MRNISENPRTRSAYLKKNSLFSLIASVSTRADRVCKVKEIEIIDYIF